MKFIIWRESKAHCPPGEPPTTFKAMTYRLVSTAYNGYTEWTMDIKDMADLKAFQRYERDNYEPIFKTPGMGDRGVRLEIKFAARSDTDGTITILDKRAGSYGGYR